ncbi:cortex morphogenetic protein CmpA [Seinonella peptonophila]|nr:cortex morphogenetic protein CmpA [Seinonella peptonophila]
MPKWLMKQLKSAFLNKNRRQIRLLNECWFSYRQKQ